MKDIIETAALLTRMNSPLFESWRSGRDAACVRALRQGGAIVLGKTVTTEFAAGRSGPTVHPLDEPLSRRLVERVRRGNRGRHAAGCARHAIRRLHVTVGLQLIGFEGADDRLAARARWFLETLA